MKQKCILCKKRNTKQKKPFCPYCYKHAGVFAKLKAFKNSRYYTNIGIMSHRSRSRPKYQSYYLREKFGNTDFDETIYQKDKKVEPTPFKIPNKLNLGEDDDENN